MRTADPTLYRRQRKGEPSVGVSARALLGYMQQAARFRDHLYFASDTTAATALGVSRMTVQRAKRELERAGLVERTTHPRFRRTVVYRLPRVTQRSFRAQETRFKTAPRTFRFAQGPRGRARPPADRRGRRRRLMEKHPERLTEGVVRKNGSVTAFNAGDAVAATVDACRGMGIPVAPSIKARLGKGAKALIEAGFDPRIVCGAMVRAIETGWFGSVETIAQEMSVAFVGHRVERHEHQRTLGEISSRIAHSDSLVWQTMRDELARRAEKEVVE